MRNPSPDKPAIHLQIPENKPVKESEKGKAISPDDLEIDATYRKLLAILGIDPDREISPWWATSSAHEHIRSWLLDLGLSREKILSVALDTRKIHPTPPDGPKALDRAMRREAAHCKNTFDRKPNAQKKQQQASVEDQIEYYAECVNSDRYLPPNTINNRIRDLLLESGRVTEAQLKRRGIK